MQGVACFLDTVDARVFSDNFLCSDINAEDIQLQAVHAGAATAEAHVDPGTILDGTSHNMVNTLQATVTIQRAIRTLCNHLLPQRQQLLHLLTCQNHTTPSRLLQQHRHRPLVKQKQRRAGAGELPEEHVQRQGSTQRVKAACAASTGSIRPYISKCLSGCCIILIQARMHQHALVLLLEAMMVRAQFLVEPCSSCQHRLKRAPATGARAIAQLAAQPQPWHVLSTLAEHAALCR